VRNFVIVSWISRSAHAKSCSVPSPPANAKYGATISNDVTDSSDAVVIPKESRAQLVAVPAKKARLMDVREALTEPVKWIHCSELERKAAIKEYGFIGLASISKVWP